MTTTYSLKRVTTQPASPLAIVVDAPRDEKGEFQGAFSHQFATAGQDGDTHLVSEHVARVIMADAGLAEHFKCTPPIKPAASKAAKVAKEPEPAAGEAEAAGGKA